MTPEQIDKLYCKYEARLGASMTKTLGNSFINLYVMGVSKYFKVVDPPKLIQDLKEDPFLNHGLTNICCELYYKYGMYLAPFTAMLTTARHIEPLASIDFKNKDENNDIKMMNENSKQEETGEEKERAERDTPGPLQKKYSKNPKPKDPKRVAAGKKVQKKKMKAELRKKEEKIKKENAKFKMASEKSDLPQITKRF
ncbi:unnamed protein product [Mytilus coruscus]|uniref:Uncharacterized protein n=1 Tax=Mytilus coruscus TaxID=42192 RepID=A0A6J8D1H8_MYTCO|nr:unnamed protein product [Mytilus coruscus]